MCEYNNGGGGASEISPTWGGACPKRLKTPAVYNRQVSQVPSTKTQSAKYCLMIFYRKKSPKI